MGRGRTGLAASHRHSRAAPSQAAAAGSRRRRQGARAHRAAARRRRRPYGACHQEARKAPLRGSRRSSPDGRRRLPAGAGRPETVRTDHRPGPARRRKPGRPGRGRGDAYGPLRAAARRRHAAHRLVRVGKGGLDDRHSRQRHPACVSRGGHGRGRSRQTGRGRRQARGLARAAAGHHRPAGCQGP